MTETQKKIPPRSIAYRYFNKQLFRIDSDYHMPVESDVAIEN